MTAVEHFAVASAQVPYEIALLADIEPLEQRSRAEQRVTAADVDALLARYGTRFD